MSWTSVDPRTGASMSYTPAQTQAIEAAYQQDPQGSYAIQLGTNMFTIEFPMKPTMVQRNQHGATRVVFRTAPAPDSTVPPQGQPGYPPQGQPGYPPQQQPGYPPPQQPGYSTQGQPGYPPPQYQYNYQYTAPPAQSPTPPLATAGAAGGGAHTTTTSMPTPLAPPTVTWASIDPRNSKKMDYDPGVSAQLEAEYQKDPKAVVKNVAIAGMTFTVDLGQKVQINSSGGQRAIVRQGGGQQDDDSDSDDDFDADYDDSDSFSDDDQDSSTAVTWVSIDPSNGKTVNYPPHIDASIEASYQADPKGEAHVTLVAVNNMKLVIDFSDMVQRNDRGGTRDVKRLGGAPAPAVADKPPLPFTPAEIKDVLAVVEEFDVAVADLEKNEGDRSYKFAFDPGHHGKNSRPVIDALDRIIQGFKMPDIKSKYGYDRHDDREAMKLRLDDPVPHYYANVNADGQSIFQRKLLSLAGLRNLVIYGPQVFEEMRAKLFSGSLGAYSSREGPNKMLHFTGNAVDLDSVVLRADDKSTLAAVNATQAKNGGPQFSSGDELGKSDTGKQIAINCAANLIDDFVARFKLSDTEIQSRFLDMSHEKKSGRIHVATNNADRGKKPIWHYNNVGQSSFHANVPFMPDIYGALLRAPYHLAKAIVLIFERHTPGSPEFVKSIEDFYEDAIADSCFNGKWKAIEAFCESMEATGTISSLLSQIQATHQDKFTSQFFASDPDRVQEEELMVTLAVGTLGRDDASGATRKITAQDVREWIEATN